MSRGSWRWFFSNGLMSVYVSNEKKLVILGYLGDYTTQLRGDNDKPL